VAKEFAPEFVLVSAGFEGGYSLDALGACVAAHLAPLLR
jgi:acetoin utilization deacetylase AcuC-like enzyme